MLTSGAKVITAIGTLLIENIILAFVETRLLDHEVKIARESQDTSAKVISAKTVNKNLKTIIFLKKRPNNKFECGRTIINCHHCSKTLNSLETLV